MKPPSPASVGRDRKLQSAMEFAVALQNKLASLHEPPAIELHLADLSQHAQAIQRMSQANTTGIDTKICKDLDRQGRNLWNLCVRLKREKDLDSAAAHERGRLLIRTRVLGFHMVELGRQGHRRQRDGEAEIVYLLNLALILGRSCIADSDLESARLVLQKAAEYVERLKDIESRDVQCCNKFEAEYLTLRTALSWKEDRLDVAEHMFAKAESLYQSLDALTAEHMADTLHHIGESLSKDGDHAMAVKWLKRSYNLVSSQGLERLSTSGLELRLAICQGLFQELLRSGSPESLQEANDLVAYIQSEIGDKPIVLHWQLEMLQQSSDEIFDVDCYASILLRMIRSFDFLEATFQFLLYHITEFRVKRLTLACELLDRLLRLLLLNDRRDWVDKVVVRRIWLAAMEVDSRDALVGLTGLLDEVKAAIPQPLKPEVAGAAHSLVWTKIEALFGNRIYHAVDDWCAVALHAVFSNSGELNQGKFTRKQIACALALNDAERAISIFHATPEATQDHELTRYLMFRVSLVNWDHELGRRSIECIGKSMEKNKIRDILYACIREAQQVGDKLCTLAALRAVARSWETGTIAAGNFPCILRCAIRLIHLIEDEETSDDEKKCDSTGFVDDLCELFGVAASQAKYDPRDENGDKIFTVPELDWFRKNSYNIGASKCHLWELPQLVRIFSCCLAIIDCYPKDVPLEFVADLALMAMRCHFVIAAALISLARSHDKLDEQLQCYTETRQHVAAFDSLLQTEIQAQDRGIIADLMIKMSTLFVFEFESAVALRSWDDLGGIVRKSTLARDDATYKAMGDCLLRSQAPANTLYSTMRLIINGIHELEYFDNEKLAKYIRCIFQAILPLDSELALQLVDQALQIAREGSQVEKPFPSAELEWLVATAFNHAVDFYARGEEEPCHRWALKAMDLAEYIGDGGGLRDMLMDKFAKLRLVGGGRRGDAE